MAELEQVASETGIDFDNLVAANTVLETLPVGQVKQLMNDLGAMIGEGFADEINETLTALPKIGEDAMPMQDYLDEAPLLWDNVEKKMFRKKEDIMPLQLREVDLLKAKLEEFYLEIRAFRNDFRKNAPFEKVDMVWARAWIPRTGFLGDQRRIATQRPRVDVLRPLVEPGAYHRGCGRRICDARWIFCDAACRRSAAGGSLEADARASTRSSRPSMFADPQAMDFGVRTDENSEPTLNFAE